VVVVLAIPGSGCWVEQVITSRDQLEDLEHKIVSHRPIGGDIGTGLTTHATLHISALVPHFAPSITSGQRYCRVWISSVKWCSVQVANNKSARSDDKACGRHTIPEIRNLDGNPLVNLQSARTRGLVPETFAGVGVHGHEGCG
jgi:hypothetical protein